MRPLVKAVLAVMIERLLEVRLHRWVLQVIDCLLFYLGRLIEYADTQTIFMNPSNPQTEAYVSGRFG